MCADKTKETFGLFGKDVTILVQFLGEKDIFVVGYNGPLQGLDEIEKELNEPESCEMFAKGHGEYVFECAYDSGQFGEYGRCEMPPYWGLKEVDFKSYNIKEPT